MSQPFAPVPHAGPPARYAPPRQREALPRVGVILAMVASLVVAGVSIGTAVVAFAASDLDPAGDEARLTALEVPQEVVDRIVLFANLTIGASVLLLLALLLGGIGVIRWQSRALDNFGALAVPPPRLSPTAAGFAWFVPIWNLFGPKQGFNDIWRSGDARAAAYLPVPDFRALPVSGSMAAWWGCWIGANVLGSLSARVPVETLGFLAGGALVNVFVQLALIVAGLLFLRILRAAGERQDARYAALTRPAPGQTVTDSGTPATWWGPGPAAWTNP